VESRSLSDATNSADGMRIDGDFDVTDGLCAGWSGRFDLDRR
jgi:hypothetical protein